jgi:hypothetical protein
MTRLKGFGGQIDGSLLESGVMHEPNISNLRQAEIIDGSEPMQRHLDALTVGIPVVSLAYQGTLRPTRGFEYFPDKIIDESRSAHGVSFGRFFGGMPGTPTREATTLLSTAIKPFDNPESALREFYGYRRLGDLAVETFSPVGIFPSKSGDHFIAMTKTRRDLMSLDRAEWLVGQRVDSAESAEIAERNERTVSDVAEGFAYIHALGDYHPDGQVKNWAVTPADKIGIIDTENFRSSPLGSTDGVILAWGDIEKFTKSLVFDSRDEGGKMFGVGMFAGQPLTQVRASIGVVERFYNDQAWPLNIVAQLQGTKSGSSSSGSSR